MSQNIIVQSEQQIEDDCQYLSNFMNLENHSAKKLPSYQMPSLKKQESDEDNKQRPKFSKFSIIYPISPPEIPKEIETFSLICVEEKKDPQNNFQTKKKQSCPQNQKIFEIKLFCQIIKKQENETKPYNTNKFKECFSALDYQQNILQNKTKFKSNLIFKRSKSEGNLKKCKRVHFQLENDLGLQKNQHQSISHYNKKNNKKIINNDCFEEDKKESKYLLQRIHQKYDKKHHAQN